MVAVAEGETGIVVPESTDDEKASLNTTRFQPEVRRSRIKKKPKKKKLIIIDTSMEFKSAEVPYGIDDSEEKAPISAKVKKVLQKKVKDHNAKNPKYRATYGMLAKVFRRGVGAYRNNPSSGRGNVSSATQRGVARVKAFIKGLKGKFPRRAYDRD